MRLIQMMLGPAATAVADAVVRRERARQVWRDQQRQASGRKFQEVDVQNLLEWAERTPSQVPYIKGSLASGTLRVQFGYGGRTYVVLYHRECLFVWIRQASGESHCVVDRACTGLVDAGGPGVPTGRVPDSRSMIAAERPKYQALYNESLQALHGLVGPKTI